MESSDTPMAPPEMCERVCSCAVLRVTKGTDGPPAMQEWCGQVTAKQQLMLTDSSGGWRSTEAGWCVTDGRGPQGSSPFQADSCFARLKRCGHGLAFPTDSTAASGAADCATLDVPRGGHSVEVRRHSAAPWRGPALDGIAVNSRQQLLPPDGLPWTR